MSADGDFAHAWTTDANGIRVRHGLTAAETEEVEQLRAARAADQPYDMRRNDELWQKHEVARRRTLGAEVEARQYERKH